MKRFNHSAVLLFFITIIAFHAAAQPHTTTLVRDYLRGESEVFSDAFTGYEEGKFPSARWELLSDENGMHDDTPTRAGIKKLAGSYCLYFSQGNGNYARPKWDTTGCSTMYKDSYWTIEFDFQMKMIVNNSENAIRIHIGEQANNCSWVDFDRHWEGGNEVYVMQSCDSMWKGHKETYPIPYNKAVWHHFAVSIKGKAAKGYIDGFRLLDFNFLSSYLPDLTIGGRGEVGIKNFRIARTDVLHPPVTDSLQLLITENRFVTHAITFDRNKAAIKPEGMPFINQLADFMKANPGIRLEIDGHTDNDGTAAVNMILSKSRAEAIKSKLISLGIAAERLEVKGFGATKPIDNNTTEAGKAQNRRVEFIKL